VLRPAVPDAVVAVMTALHQRRQRVVVQGGMTGLVGAAMPQDDEVILSLERLNRIEHIDTQAATMTVQAGVTLQAVQEAAQQHGLFFPVDIGSRGSCQIGGMIATNAGGNRVLRYGMMRQSVLGLEVVLADGRVVSRMGGMLKDNAGYDLSQLFIGSEGTLGVVTRAILALQPAPRHQQTALVSVADFGQMRELLALCRQRLGSLLTSFEAMWRDYYDHVTGPLQICRAPLTGPGRLMVLVEIMGADARADTERFTAMLADFLQAHPENNAALAQSLADGQDFWRLRDASGDAARSLGAYAAYDVSIPLSRMEPWVDQVHRQLRAAGYARTQTYGHVGDGNLHLVVQLAAGTPGYRRMADEIVYSAVGGMGGSVSAEHGIGMDKKKVLGWSRSATEVEAMQALKRVLDPEGLLNRGRIFDF
jgi:FAD/FMN-containing dehydrogenase